MISIRNNDFNENENSFLQTKPKLGSSHQKNRDGLISLQDNGTNTTNLKVSVKLSVFLKVSSFVTEILVKTERSFRENSACCFNKCSVKHHYMFDLLQTKSLVL